MWYNNTSTWKVTYFPKTFNGGQLGVAFIEAESRQSAMYAFQEQYAGQYNTVRSCEKLLG